jgi:hypothetical protein
VEKVVVMVTSCLKYSTTARIAEFRNRFGLFLDSKKARGMALKPWSFIIETRLSGGMVPLYVAARTFFVQNPTGREAI